MCSTSDLIGTYSQFIWVLIYYVIISGIKSSHLSAQRQIHTPITLKMEWFIVASLPWFWCLFGVFLPVWQPGYNYGTFIIINLVTVRAQKCVDFPPHKDRNIACFYAQWQMCFTGTILRCGSKQPTVCTQQLHRVYEERGSGIMATSPTQIFNNYYTNAMTLKDNSSLLRLGS